MKNTILIITMFLMFISGIYSAGVEEENQTITVLTAGNPEYPNGKTMMEIATDLLKVDYPNVVIEMNTVDLSDGSTLTLDAMIAAGTAPNVYLDTIVRSSKYMVPEYALALDEYVSDLNAYEKSTLAPYRRDGKLYGLPQAGGAQGMCINLDLLADVGYQLPDAKDWTIAEFLKLAELVKDKYPGEKFVTGMFAANQSGDYLINNWFASFGVQYYANGYDYTTIKDTGGAAVYEFFQMLVDEEFIPPHAAQLTDDDYVMQWAKGELAATAFFEGWTAIYIDAANKLGYEPFDYVFYPFPKAPGVDKVPTYFMNGVIIVNNSDSELKNKIAGKLAQYLNCVEIQEQGSLQNVLPTRTDARNLSSNIHNVEISQIVSDNGFFDVGLTNPTFPIIRPLHYPILQKVLEGTFTPEEAITEYEKRINAEL